MTALAVIVSLAAAVVAGLRWLRVAQREHYLPGSVARFAWRWWLGFGPNRLLAVAAVVAVAGAAVRPLGAFVAAAAVTVGPFGLAVRGTAPGPLAWTRRLKTLAGTWALLHLLLVALGMTLGVAAFAAALMAVLTPLLIDGALALTRPVEDRLARRFVDQAAAKLRSIRPRVVAVTGSYGKTSTKGYLAHLLSATHTVLATPRSFNNRAGLARAVNEHLAPGTEVFIAEMGTYGPGEIADMCRWATPSIGMITAIGPVHLERFGSEDRIVEAKAEILDGAEVAVLNVDDRRLRALADRVAATGTRVVRCGSVDGDADVVVRVDATAQVLWRGEKIAEVADLHAPPTNVACAVAAALELRTPPDTVAELLATLPTADHRLAVSTGAAGFTILDDTYNSNPAGATLALARLVEAAPVGRRVVVTPGMVELGPRQADENRAFAAAAGRQATDLVVVGFTNRRALLEGAEGGAQVVCVDNRDQAVAWVRGHLGPGDAVLYENDLPDHYP